MTLGERRASVRAMDQPDALETAVLLLSHLEIVGVSLTSEGVCLTVESGEDGMTYNLGPPGGLLADAALEWKRRHSL